MNAHTCRQCEACDAVYAALVAVAKAYAGTYATETEPGFYEWCLKCRQPDADILHLDGCPIAAVDALVPLWRA